MKISIINGPNLNLLGKLEPEIYGNQTFEAYFNSLQEKFPQLELTYYQSNIEGELIDKIQELGFTHDGIILNADASTTFAPSVGYFVSDNISLAASLATSNNGDDKSTIIGLGAAYVFNAGNQFSSQIGASVGFGNGSESGVDFNATAFSLSYGINYFVSSNFALTANLAALEYVSVKDDVAGAKAVNTTSIGVDLSNISLGLAYKF